MRGLAVPDDVLCYVASKVENNTRELEGAIVKIQGMSLLQGGRIDIDLAKSAWAIQPARKSGGSRSSRFTMP